MKVNGTVKWISLILTIAAIFAGIMWNAAILNNDMVHLKEDVKEFKKANSEEHKEIKNELKQIRQAVFER